MPTPSSPPRSSAPDAMLSHLPATAAALAHSPRGDDAVVDWRFPALPISLRETLTAAARVDIRSDDAGADPRDVPSFAAILAAVRAEQVLLALSAHTNLLLAGTTAVVVGDGPLADRLTIALGRIGTRVVRRSDDPRTLLRARLDGLATDTTGHHYVVATGEGHDPLDTGSLTGIVVDASIEGDAIVGAPGSEARAQVHGDAQTWVVEIPPPLPLEGETPTPQQWRIVDALAALGVTARATTDPDDLDRLLAEAATS